MIKRSMMILLLALPFLINAQSYVELKDSKPFDNKEVWQNSFKGEYQFKWGNTDTRYPKLSVPNKAGMENNDGNATAIKLIAWQGERVNAQAVLSTKVDLSGVSFSVSDLKSGSSTISSSAIKIQPVSYVMTDELSKDGTTGCGHRPDPTVFDSTLVADVLNNEYQNLEIEAFTTKPVWLTMHVPTNIKAGKYNGTLTANVNGKASNLKIEITVKNRQIANAANWNFHLDLWQNPYAVARYYDVELWSQEHFELMKPLMKMLANAGQKIVTTTIMHKPWAGQTEDAFSSMVSKIKHIDGTWEYRYDAFDKWVTFMMDEVGINEQINCYTMIPWAMSFDYFDMASNSIKFIEAKTDSKEFEQYWLPFIADFAKHLKSKGWFEKTTIAMDERAMKDMQNTIAIIKRADANFKVSLAGNYHSEIEADIYDYCIAFGQEFPKAVKERRDSENKISTVYTCCAEPFPNTFTFSSPAEATWIGWHSIAGNYDGYLRWAYNSWTKNPLQDSRFRTWAGGDTYIVYPDGRSSIRFERLIEGIQDYEKISILRKEFTNNPSKLQKLEDMISTFMLETKGDISTEQQVINARKLLNSF